MAHTTLSIRYGVTLSVAVNVKVLQLRGCITWVSRRTPNAALYGHLFNVSINTAADLSKLLTYSANPDTASKRKHLPLIRLLVSVHNTVDDMSFSREEFSWISLGLRL
ncbi:hypothetical protein LSAT2_015466, partial [Lamellibrachia satsuma]